MRMVEGSMFQTASMKKVLQYDQQTCRLSVEGLPDFSAGHGSDAVGIITGWSLAWVGRPEELEGRREHLQAILQVVLPYARHLISGVRQPLGGAAEPAAIGPGEDGRHVLWLLSSQPDVEPLALQLDDAELADLVRVLDRLRLDPRLPVEWPVPPPRPLRAREVQGRTPLPQRLSGVLGGAAALGLSAAAVWLLPPPPPPQPGSTPPAAARSGSVPATGATPGAVPRPRP
jgi:hypothetical protein